MSNCPICKIKEIYYKERIVNDGITTQDEDGNYNFKKTGTKKVIDQYWSCEKCTKIFKAKEYNLMLVDFYTIGKVCLLPKQVANLKKRYPAMQYESIC